ncbi:MAG: hypothetical protein AAF657_25355 [Acidobacteriota bacterium]
MGRPSVVCFLAVVLLAGVSPAQEEATEDRGSEAAEQRGLRYAFGFEAKAHFRSSVHDRSIATRVAEPTDPSTPITLTTVNAGEHFELSTLTLFADAFWGGAAGVQAHLKLDLIDLYERNPTSTDREVDVDEIWLRIGREHQPGEMPVRRGAYFKIGKFGHFERQDERHLESYGLTSTTFNRLEDIGLEVGVDLSRHIYLKLSATQGNPVFFRDPNALAGDVGDSLLNPSSRRLGGGLGLIYDAEVEDLDIDGDLELGGGLGFRFGDAFGNRAVDILLWAYGRDLAPTVPLRGSAIGGDLELLLGPGDLSQPLPVTDDRKREVGGNVWWYHGPLSFFGQYVDQELAGLPRRSFEAELAWFVELPLRWSAFGGQLFRSMTPVVRYSRLFNDFEHPEVTALPSLAWDWYKLDVGLRVEILEGVDLTLEYAFNHGYLTDINEALVTFRWARR